jgi:hypothetical protein
MMRRMNFQRLFVVMWSLALPAFAGEWTNAPVRELQLFKTYGDSAAIFDRTVKIGSLTNGVGKFLEATVDDCAARAKKAGSSPQSIGSMRGRWLEWAVLVALKQQGITPAYWQAEFTKVPNAFNDVTLWSKEHGPVILSCKTSLRERYKQGDLEAAALKLHYPAGKFFLVTLDEDKKHVARVRKKIADGEIIALHAVYDETDADELFAFLRTLKVGEPDAGVLRSSVVVR